MTKVYLISGGYYSDYHVDGVYTSEAVANRVAAQLGLEVEERELDEHDPSAWPEGKRSWSVRGYGDAASSDPGNRSPADNILSAYTTTDPPDVDPVWRHRSWVGGYSYEIAVWGETKAEAIAVAKSITKVVKVT